MKINFQLKIPLSLLLDMRYIALIFAFLIFGQSLSVCAPDIALLPKDVATKVCTASSSEKKHSCCKSEEHDTEKEQKDGCCGEGCKCFSCIKVFVQYFNNNSTDLVFQEKIIAKRNISPVLFYSFDFHYTLINPPQVK